MPTGWTYEMKHSTFPVKEKGAVKIHLVPYSEHSSYTELRDYVRWLRPAQVRLLTSCPQIPEFNECGGLQLPAGSTLRALQRAQQLRRALHMHAVAAPCPGALSGVCSPNPQTLEPTNVLGFTCLQDPDRAVERAQQRLASA